MTMLVITCILLTSNSGRDWKPGTAPPKRAFHLHTDLKRRCKKPHFYANGNNASTKTAMSPGSSGKQRYSLFYYSKFGLLHWDMDILTTRKREEILIELKDYPTVLLSDEVSSILRCTNRYLRQLVNHIDKDFWKGKVINERPKKFLKTDVTDYLLYRRGN